MVGKKNTLFFFPLQLAHGADPTLKNQEGQTPLALCSADDVKCLLQDAMPSNLAAIPVTPKSAADVVTVPKPAVVGAAAGASAATAGATAPAAAAGAASAAVVPAAAAAAAAAASAPGGAESVVMPSG